MGLENWTITISNGGDYCLPCGGLIQDCGPDCPVLKIIAEEFEKETE